MQQGDLSASGGAATPRPLHRLFFALMPDEETCERLHQAARQLKATHRTRGRWINPRRYHLTLQFLGDFDGYPATVVAQARAAAASVRVAPFTVVLDHAGSFQNRSIPWWLGPRADAPGLAALWHELGAALSRTGVHVPDGKGFRPHVTLLRDAGTALPGIDIEPAVPWRVDAFTLMHSELGAQSHYVPLGTWPLVA